MVTNPLKMADIFNNYFKKKITLLRQKTASAAEIEPATRLRDWLGKRAEPPPEFKIRKINLTTLRKAIKKVKGKRVHGRDEIDSYSLKVSAPLIEDSLLHLVNLCSPLETTINPTFSHKKRENKG